MVRKTPSRSQRVAKGPHKGPKRAKKMPRGTQRVAKGPQKVPKWLPKPSKRATKSTVLRGPGAWDLISQKVKTASNETSLFETCLSMGAGSAFHR